ncbi:hypothetical protein AJ88_08510 [Mesorhizobium amorphae CCBAU 01583]|nr:hypothetical protein AJ88_08510 [Mesorhizobium amorphae CCBAU 01583]
MEFVDQLYAVDPKGTVGAPYRYVLFGIPVHKTGSSENVLMLFDGLSRGGAGPYGIAETAKDDVNRGVHYNSSPTTVSENWNFEGGSEKVSLQTEFERGPMTLEKGDSHVYSQLKPEFSRIYRYKEATDVVKSGDANHLRSLSLKAEGGKLTASSTAARALSRSYRCLSIPATSLFRNPELRFLGGRRPPNRLPLPSTVSTAPAAFSLPAHVARVDSAS